MLSRLRHKINLLAFKSVFLSWDFFVAATLSLGVALFAPNNISNEVSRDIYNIGVTSLSIIFSVYFAALAMIITSSDNDFIDFFDQENDYSRLIKSFRFVLAILLISLLVSIGLYIISTVLFYEKKPTQIKAFMVLFSFLGPYSLIATFLASNDAIQYALLRAKYLKVMRNIEATKKRDGNF
jgi:cytochrome c biogenesis protein CcdA